MTAASKLDRKCAFLGLKNDPDTCLDYPSRSNYCHKSQPLATISLEHQEKICSTQAYANCPLFSQAEKAPLPPELRGRPDQPVRSKKPAARGSYYILGVIAMMVILGVGLPSFLPPSSALPLEATQDIPAQKLPGTISTALLTQSITPTLTDTVIPTATPTLTASPAPSLTATLSPLPPATAAKAARKVRALDTEFGSEFEFTIHKMEAGASLALYAQKYQTSVEAIEAINDKLVFPLWENTVVIIPIGLDEVKNLPKFQAYMVEEDGLSVEQIAQALKSDPASIKKYNDLEDDYRSLSGDWLIIPRIDSTPTP